MYFLVSIVYHQLFSTECAITSTAVLAYVGPRITGHSFKEKRALLSSPPSSLIEAALQSSPASVPDANVLHLKRIFPFSCECKVTVLRAVLDPTVLLIHSEKVWCVSCWVL